MPTVAKVYCLTVIAAGSIVAGLAMTGPVSAQLSSALKLLVLAAAASIYKVKLPRIDGTYSLNFVFILVAVARCNLSQAVLIGCVAGAVQCLWKRQNRPTVLQVLFNVAAMAITVAAAFWAYVLLLDEGQAFSVGAAALIYFFVNSYVTAQMMALASGEPVQQVWQHWFIWSFPYFVVGAAIATAEVLADNYVLGKLTIILLPICYVAFCYYRAIVQMRGSAERGALG